MIINKKLNNDIVKELKINGHKEPIGILEKDIQRTINVKDLELNLIGYEYNTIVGNIDILCEDKDNNLIPVEIKLGTASDSAIGQILGYMKVMGSNYGVIIAKNFSNRLKFLCNDYNIILIHYISYKKDNMKNLLIYDGLINQFKNENFLLLNFDNTEVNKIKNDNKDGDNVEETGVEPKIKDKSGDPEDRIQKSINNWEQKRREWEMDNGDDIEKKIGDCKLRYKLQCEKEELEEEKRFEIWRRNREESKESELTEYDKYEGDEMVKETKTIKPKEYSEDLSEMEINRLKSVDPKFLHECDVQSRKTHEANRERDYIEFLKWQTADEVKQRNRSRIKFEKSLSDE